MYKKEVYAVQPYKVGSKNANSLAVILPAMVVKEYNVNTSTVFALRADDKTKKIVLQTINKPGTQKTKTKNIVIPTGESLAASSQQASSRAQ
jgi:antitoxin component of MazEF toxin-antitoxin module